MAELYDICGKIASMGRDRINWDDIFFCSDNCYKKWTKKERIFG